MSTQRWPEVVPSDAAVRSRSLIAEQFDSMDVAPNPNKKMLRLSVGDPTVFGNLNPADVVIESVVDAIRSMNFNGYTFSIGNEKAREAIAAYISTDKIKITREDVIICSGCSSALEMCITALANPGDNILIPRPGFFIYEVLARTIDVHAKFYNLLPDQQWKVDLEMMDREIDDHTRAIVINTPSNPCGSVFDEAHIRQILEVAARRRVPIIADEIYDHFAFPGNEFYYMASFTKDVPILSCNGLTKRFLVPGWRMGWITIHDPLNVLAKVRKGLHSLSERTLGANTIVQGAIPAILSQTPPEFYRNTMEVVQTNADICSKILSAVKGLNPIMPHGAMYMMVGIDMARFPTFKTDVEIAEALISEESVFCLPGTFFYLENYVRLVLTVPHDVMSEACERIREFCAVHDRDNGGSGQCDSAGAVPSEPTAPEVAESISSSTYY